MKQIDLTYLNGPDIEALALTDDEILGAIEASLASQGRGECVIEPRMHLKPHNGVDGHFNVLRGALGAPINLAGVKVRAPDAEHRAWQDHAGRGNTSIASDGKRHYSMKCVTRLDVPVASHQVQIGVRHVES